MKLRNSLEVAGVLIAAQSQAVGIQFVDVGVRVGDVIGFVAMGAILGWLQ